MSTLTCKVQMYSPTIGAMLVISEDDMDLAKLALVLRFLTLDAQQHVLGWAS